MVGSSLSRRKGFLCRCLFSPSAALVESKSRLTSTMVSSSCFVQVKINSRTICTKKRAFLRIMSTDCCQIEEKKTYYKDMIGTTKSIYPIKTQNGKESPRKISENIHVKQVVENVTNHTISFSSLLGQFNDRFKLLAFPSFFSSSLSVPTKSFFHTYGKNQSMNRSNNISTDSSSSIADGGNSQIKKKSSGDTKDKKKSDPVSGSENMKERSTFQPTSDFNSSSNTKSMSDSVGTILEPDLWDALESGQLGKLLPRRQIPKDVLTIETVAYWNSTSQVPIFGNVFGKNRPGQNNNVQVSPDQYKITLRVNISDLQLDQKSEARLRCLVGPRFNHKTNEIVLKSQRFLNRIHNMQYLVYLLENLVTEAKGENEGEVSVDEDMKEYNLHTGEKQKKGE